MDWQYPGSVRFIELTGSFVQNAFFNSFSVTMVENARCNLLASNMWRFCLCRLLLIGRRSMASPWVIWKWWLMLLREKSLVSYSWKQKTFSLSAHACTYIPLLLLHGHEPERLLENDLKYSNRWSPCGASPPTLSAVDVIFVALRIDEHMKAAREHTFRVSHISWGYLWCWKGFTNKFIRPCHILYSIYILNILDQQKSTCVLQTAPIPCPYHFQELHHGVLRTVLWKGH